MTPSRRAPGGVFGLSVLAGFLAAAFALFFFDHVAPYHIAQGKLAAAAFFFVLFAGLGAGPVPRRAAFVHPLLGGAALAAFAALELTETAPGWAAPAAFGAAAWFLVFAPTSALVSSGAAFAAGFPLGMISAGFACYLAPPALTLALLFAGGIFLAAAAPFEKSGNGADLPALGVLFVLAAGTALGAAIVHIDRAWAVFQAPHPLPRHDTVVVCGLFALAGIFFARRSFPGGHHFLNLLRRALRRPPVEDALGAESFFAFSWLLLGLALLASAASFEFLGILGNTLPGYLPRGQAFSVAVIIAVKAAFVWGPLALALPGLVAAGGRRGVSLFSAGAAAGVALSLFSWRLGVVPVVYYAAGLAVLAGLAALKRRKTLFSAPMVFRLILCALLAALVLTAYAPDRTLAQRTLLFIKSGIDIRYTEEGFAAVNTVAGVDDEDPDKRRTELYEDAVYLGGLSPENRFLRLAGVLPVLYGLEPAEGLVLGFSTGVGASALRAAGCAEMTVVSPDAAKFRLSGYFAEGGAPPVEEKGVSAIAANPYLFPSAFENRFDVVLFEPRPVSLAGGWEQYDLRVLSAVRRALKPGGVCILPVTGLSAGAFEEVLSSFRSVFAGTDVFCFRVGVVLAGFEDPDAKKFSLEGFRRFMKAHPDFCKKANLRTEYDTLAGYIARFRREESSPFPFSGPRAPYREEWLLKSASARQGGTFKELLKRRAGAEQMKGLIEGGFDEDALLRFHASGGEVIEGMAEFLSASDPDAPKRAAEHFRTAVEGNQGDYEAKWFLNYLVKVGSVTLEGPKPQRKELNKLLQTVLTSQDNDERVRALRKLGLYAGELDVRDVLVVINDSDPAIRRELAYLLGHFDDALSRQAVLRLMKDPEPEVVRAAIRACVRQRNTDAVDRLLELLDDEKLAGAAIEALQKLGSSRAAAQLARKLGEMSGSGALHVLDALRKVGTPAQAEEIASLLDSPDERLREAAVLALRGIAKRHEDGALARYFLRALKDEAFWVRVQAVEGLKEVPVPEAYEPLIAAFVHPPENENDETLDCSILVAAARCGGKKALKFLLGLKDDPNVNIACSAVRSIGLTGAPEAERILLDIAENGKDQIIRSAALGGLFNLGPETALRLLPDFAYSRDALVARTAVRFIAETRTPQAADIIRRFLVSGDRTLALNAAEFAWQTRDRSLADELFRLAETGDPESAAVACRSLARLADDRIMVKYCRELLEHPLPAVRLAAARELRRLPSDADRSYAVSALVKALSPAEPRENLAAYTRTLALLAELPGAPVIRRESDEREVAEVIAWWKNRYLKPGRGK